MNELKWGDKIQVRDGELWVERVFLHKYEDGSCVSIFSTVKWQKDQWRQIPEKKIIPFDFSDAPLLIGRPVKSMSTNNIYTINTITEDGTIIDRSRHSWDNLLNHFTFLDGSPCGKED